MKKVKTRHKDTGKIEIFDEFIAEQNSSLEIIDEGDHLEEEYKEERIDLKDKEDLRAARKRKRRKKMKSRKVYKKKSNPTSLGYGEDEGENQSIRLRG